MGIRIDKSKAAERFLEALALARSDTTLPKEWLDRSRKIATASSMTFIPMLGTALLAKATDDRVWTRALKVTARANAYSARGVCHQVLVPLCVTEAINLRNTGPEPLNNQPFFRYDDVSRSMRTRVPEAELTYLVDTLERADRLNQDDALRALAAFLRARLEDPAPEATILRAATLGDVWPLDDVSLFIRRRTDGGRRGQACVAAALDLLHRQVSVSRVNDPSREYPGDVHVGSGVPTLAVEARQKTVSHTDVSQFVARCAAKGIPRAAVAAFATAQRPLPLDRLRQEATVAYGVLLDVWHDPAELLGACAMHASGPPKDTWPRFAERMLRRLEDLETPRDTIEGWVALVESTVEA